LPQEFELLQLPPATLAAQLTIFEFNIFRQITAEEFLNQRWKKDNKGTLAPNISAMIEQFNRVTLLFIYGYL
jgi:plasmid rolling circle replication initiator protein Rep